MFLLAFVAEKNIFWKKAIDYTSNTTPRAKNEKKSTTIAGCHSLEWPIPLGYPLLLHYTVLSFGLLSLSCPVRVSMNYKIVVHQNKRKRHETSAPVRDQSLQVGRTAHFR
jgi:hypothetical protein